MEKFKVFIFYFLSFTWGIINTLAGAFIALFLLIIGKKPHMFYQNIYFYVGKEWGGCNFGPFLFISEKSSLYIKQHEAGHGIQNTRFGPLTAFIIGFPSSIRYWLAELETQKARYIFVSILAVICLLLASAFLVPGIILVNIPLIVIGSLIVLYLIIMAIWLYGIEVPKYKDGPVDYYSAWFEQNASDLGQKYYPKNDEK